MHAIFNGFKLVKQRCTGQGRQPLSAGAPKRRTAACIAHRVYAASEHVGARPAMHSALQQLQQVQACIQARTHSEQLPFDLIDPLTTDQQALHEVGLGHAAPGVVAPWMDVTV